MRLSKFGCLLILSCCVVCELVTGTKVGVNNPGSDLRLKRGTDFMTGSLLIMFANNFKEISSWLSKLDQKSSKEVGVNDVILWRIVSDRLSALVTRARDKVSWYRVSFAKQDEDILQGLEKAMKFCNSIVLMRSKQVEFSVWIENAYNNLSLLFDDEGLDFFGIQGSRSQLRGIFNDIRKLFPSNANSYELVVAHQFHESVLLRTNTGGSSFDDECVRAGKSVVSTLVKYKEGKSLSILRTDLAKNFSAISVFLKRSDKHVGEDVGKAVFGVFSEMINTGLLPYLRAIGGMDNKFRFISNPLQTTLAGYVADKRVATYEEWERVVHPKMESLLNSANIHGGESSIRYSTKLIINCSS